MKLRDRGLGSADWQVFPTTPWNYALKVNTSAPEDGIEVIETEVGQALFSRAHAPVRSMPRDVRILCGAPMTARQILYRRVLSRARRRKKL